MFEANKHPEQDAKRIEALINSLVQMKAKNFILISTIAVLDTFDGKRTEVDEYYQETNPYGINRRNLEVACQAISPIALLCACLHSLAQV